MNAEKTPIIGVQKESTTGGIDDVVAREATEGDGAA